MTSPPQRPGADDAISPTFILQCHNAIASMRRAGMNETQIACVVQDIRSAALSEEFRRIRQLIEAHPPKHHRFGEMQDQITVWAKEATP